MQKLFVPRAVISNLMRNKRTIKHFSSAVAPNKAEFTTVNENNTGTIGWTKRNKVPIYLFLTASALLDVWLGYRWVKKKYPFDGTLFEVFQK